MLSVTDARRILVIQGHPDPAGGHLCHELAAAYVRGVHEGGHELRTADVSRLEFPLLRSSHEWESSPAPPDIAKVQQDIAWAQHVVLFFPLWIGDMPALLKGFLEQVARPGFAFRRKEDQPFGHKALEGRSARVVVTMGMPSVIYRLVYREHALKALGRDVLAFIGFDPVHETLVGQAEALGPEAALAPPSTHRSTSLPMAFIATCGYLFYSSVTYAHSRNALHWGAYLMIAGLFAWLIARFARRS